MKFSEKDLNILSALSVHGATAIGSLAKTARVKEHTVRRLIQRLIDEGVLKPFAFVNPFPAGFSEYGCFFSVSGSLGGAERVAKAVASSPYAAWLNEYLGDYQFGMGIFARNVKDVIAVVEDLSEKSPACISRLSISQYIGQTFYPLKYFNRSGSSAEIRQPDKSRAPPPITVEI